MYDIKRSVEIQPTVSEKLSISQHAIEFSWKIEKSYIDGRLHDETAGRQAHKIYKNGVT